MATQPQNNAELLKEYCRGKSPDQVKVIEYFCKQEGCLSKKTRFFESASKGAE